MFQRFCSRFNLSWYNLIPWSQFKTLWILLNDPNHHFIMGHKFTFTDIFWNTSDPSGSHRPCMTARIPLCYKYQYTIINFHRKETKNTGCRLYLSHDAITTHPLRYKSVVIYPWWTLTRLQIITSPEANHWILSPRKKIQFWSKHI